MLTSPASLYLQFSAVRPTCCLSSSYPVSADIVIRRSYVVC